MAHTVSLIKRQQISANAALTSVFGESGYLAEEAEMGLIRLIPRLIPFLFFVWLDCNYCPEKWNRVLIHNICEIKSIE